MLINEASTIHVGDIVRVKGTTGADEGKLGKVTDVRKIKYFDSDKIYRVVVFMDCVDGLWMVTDGSTNKPKACKNRFIDYRRLQLVERKPTVKVKVHRK